MRDCGLDLKTVKCDFEQSLINSLRDEFARDDPDAVSGCLFHWKQALRRKLLDLRVSKDVITIFLGENGLINFLVMLTYDEIPKGIAYIREELDEGTYTKQFDQFWAYFVKTWMKKTDRYDDKSGLYLFTTWNMSHLVDEHGRLALDEGGNDVSVNRTNNPLERFNRKMNEAIQGHPTVQVFVESIKIIANEYVTMMRLVKGNRVGKKRVHKPVCLPEIPAKFASFEIPN